MNYISDVIVNWQKDNDLYDFYEWNINDKIEVLNYLPVIKISFLDFYKIKRYKVSLNEEFVNLIKKDRLFGYDYNICIITNRVEAIAIAIDKNNVVKEKSKLYFDTEREVLDLNLKETQVEITIIEKTKLTQEIGLTRKEKENKKYIIQKLETLIKNNDIEQIRYLYYEWFEDFNYNFDNMGKKLINAINKGWNEKHEKLYELLKLSEFKKPQNMKNI